jgi:hypothetical protein
MSDTITVGGATTFIVQNPDNSVLLVSAMPGYEPTPVAAGLAVRTLQPGEVLPPGEFRASWTYGATIVGVNMVTATATHLANLVALAAPVMSSVRIAWTNAQMIGDSATATACVSQLTALMAVGSTDLSSATTPAELTAIVPACITQAVPVPTTPTAAAAS